MPTTALERESARPASGETELYPVVKHTLFEDVYAFFIGCTFIVLGIVFLKAAGLVTSGVAGIALLVSYLILINIPFFALAWPAMGKTFTIKTIIVNTAIVLLGLVAPMAFKLQSINPLFAALFGGTIIGMGILSLARHGAGAGGTGVLALYVQKRRGINAGKTQMACDALIMLASVFTLHPQQLLYSAISAVAMSGVLLGFHKPERYIGR
jgi:uncharacterized membrane-anchored protein YitT (DUF2179 family)